MALHKSYFSKNNTLVKDSEVNTAKNPVTELFYGGGYTSINASGGTISTSSKFSRFIFDLDLQDLKRKYYDGTIVLAGGCGNSATTHTLRMVNTSFFDTELLNTETASARMRATSFDLLLFKIVDNVHVSATTACWDEGVGYDYKSSWDFQNMRTDKSYSERPSNYYKATTLQSWLYPGIYNNGGTPAVSIIDTQHFDNGNENIVFDMSAEINNILSGGTPDDCGYGVAFFARYENMTGLTESYSVGFYTKYTQTFYEPYLESNYDDTIEDARANFYEGKTNCLYLYVNAGGNPVDLDYLPNVTIYDNSNQIVSALTSTNISKVTKGVYCTCFSIDCDTYTTPCLFRDQWSNLEINGICRDNVINKFTLRSNDEYFNIGTNAGEPKTYGYSFSGLKKAEKIVAGDVRKIIVSVRKPYTVNVDVDVSDLEYRIFVKQGTQQVETHPWAKVSRAYNQNYFIVDTGDMIPNEYFIDLKAISNLEVNSYREAINFQVVSQANYFGNPPT